MNEVKKLQNALNEKEKELKALKRTLKSNAKASKQNEELLHSLVEAAAGKIGQDFFDNIVIKLSEWLNAECVLIGRIVGYERIQAVPLYLDGKIRHDFSYDLEGSPCDITTRRGYCEYAENVMYLFPKDKILVDLHAEGYIGTALYNRSGEINGVICAVSRKKLLIPPYARDIMKIIGARVSAEIERMKTEEALKQSEAELKESNDTKDKLFSIIAHDLRSPLSTLMGFTELLTRNYEKLGSNKQKEIIRLINKSTTDTYKLLENLLTWALAQRGLIQYSQDHINLEELIKENLLLLDNMALEKEISIVNKGGKDIIVKADRQMVSIILRNLVTNAIKFTPVKGHIEISVKILPEKKPKSAEICVSDNGIGIDSSRITRLFQPESHFSESGTAAEKGTGLGLIICKEFVEKNGGVINVQSEPGKGSRFFFTLEAV